MKKKRKMRFLKQSHSAKKLEKGDPLGFLNFHFAAKYQKNLKGGTFGDKKNSEKKPHSAEKIERVAQCRKKMLEQVSG